MMHAARARTSGGMGTRLGCRGADICSALRLLWASISMSRPRIFASCLALSSRLMISPFCTGHYNIAAFCLLIGQNTLSPRLIILASCMLNHSNCPVLPASKVERLQHPPHDLAILNMSLQHCHVPPAS